MRRMIAAATAALLAAGAAASPFRDAAVVGDDELGTMRGGVLLPNGLDVSVGIAIETRVDGMLALRTLFTTEGGVQVFSGGEAMMRPQAVPTAAQASSGAPMLRIDRNGVGTTVVPAMTLPNVQVGVSRGAAAMPGGGAPLAVTPNGDAVGTPLGAVRLEQGDRGVSVVLSSPTLELRHLLGDATGVVVANTANNRAIDTVANVNIDLRNASELVGSNVLQIDAIATAASSWNPR
jgi:hypothetical protein